jgi:hypothetical protein
MKDNTKTPPVHSTSGARNRMTVLVIGLVFLGWLVGFSMGRILPETFPTCTESGLIHPNLEGRRYHALVLERDCGPIDVGRSKVELREPTPFGLQIPFPGKDRKVVFESNYVGTSIDLKWNNSNLLTITYPNANVTIWHREFKWKDVHIRYCEQGGECVDGSPDTNSN